jgi:hypothetical protein
MNWTQLTLFDMIEIQPLTEETKQWEHVLILYSKTSLEGPSVVLYSHWGQDSWQADIAAALEHARPRWSRFFIWDTDDD